MADGILGKIMSGIGAVAPTVANYIVPGSGPLLHTLMRAVTGEPEETPIEQVAARIEADPALYLELQKAAMDHEARMEELKARQLATVNATMQAEGKSEHWPQYSWRPYNGFLYGTTIFCVYFVLPMASVSVPAVPEWVWIGWGAILGVTTWDRGKTQRAKAGEEAKPGLIAQAIAAIRG